VPEAIVLQFEKELRMVERLSEQGQLGGVHSGWAHINRMLAGRDGHKRRKGESGATEHLSGY
jgi:hypothetical protein